MQIMSKTTIKKAQDLQNNWSLGSGELPIYDARFTAAEGLSNCYLIDALPYEGDWLRMLAFDSNERKRDEILVAVRDILNSAPKWSMPRADRIIPIAAAHPSLSYIEKEQTEKMEFESLNIYDDINWINDKNELLYRISHETDEIIKQKAVIISETFSFDTQDEESLLEKLGLYIEKNRFLQDESSETAVCSAIRKYALIMKVSDFARFVSWLQPTQTESVPHPIELELVKAVCNRLVYEPITSNSNNIQLASSLYELGMDYLSPRLILEKTFASTAIHCIIAVIILDSLNGNEALSQAMCSKFQATKVDWFIELVHDRIEETVIDLESYDPDLAGKVSETVNKFMPTHTSHYAS